MKYIDNLIIEYLYYYIKNPIKFNELKKLLNKNNKVEIKQKKWYSDISEGIFHVKDEIYTLMVTENKRKLLYDENNFFYGTIPFHLYNGEIVNLKKLGLI